ncbi:MAG: NnrU family protein [Burkholderiales bacterium]|nr:NnrU family protein [Burkholderiales bacterium]
MSALVAGLVLFLGVHSVRIVADRWRGDMIARLGPMRWKAVYSLLSAAGLVLVVWGYGQARLDPVVIFSPPPWTRYATSLLVLPAFVLIAAGNLPGTKMKAALGHPMVLGTGLWAFAHLLSNGLLADVVLFGAFLAWAIADYASARRRDRRGPQGGERSGVGAGDRLADALPDSSDTMRSRRDRLAGTVYPQGMNVPPEAALRAASPQGGEGLGAALRPSLGRDALAVVIGVVAAAAFALWLHGPLIGVRVA